MFEQEVGKIKTAEKNLEFNFLLIGQNLQVIKDGFKSREKFEELVNECFKFSVDKAYALVRIYKNRDYLDFKKYGCWKGFEIIKLKEEEEMREFEKTFKPEERPIIQVRQDIKQFKALKAVKAVKAVKASSVETSQLGRPEQKEEDYSGCIVYRNYVMDARRQVLALKENFNILRNMKQGLLISQKDLWDKFVDREKTESMLKETLELVESIGKNV